MPLSYAVIDIKNSQEVFIKTKNKRISIEEYTEKINNKLTNEYNNHKIFTKLKKIIDFYDLLSNIPFIAFGTTAINIDIQIFTSMKNILNSIELLLKYGKINDAYSLTRKYHDMVIINIYEILYLENKRDEGKLIVEEINNWLHGKNKLPEYRTMNQYIRNSPKLKNINNLLFKTKQYKELRQRLNDHTHYNNFLYILFNDKYQFDFENNRINLLNQLFLDIQNIFIKHFCWLFTLKDHYMMSSDYVDYLDMGRTPPDNSQYWVSPYIQEIFNNTIKPNREDLAHELKNSTCMKLQ